MNEIERLVSDRHKDVLGGKSAVVKSLKFDIKELREDSREFRAVITKASVDMHGELVVPGGIDRSYFMAEGKKNPLRTVYWMHDYSCPIGACRNLEVKPDSVSALTYVSTTPFASDVLTMIREEVVSGVSIGFLPLSRRAPGIEEKRVHGKGLEIVTEKWLMLEYSVTPIPCHPDAVIELVSKGLIGRGTAARMGLEASAARKAYPVSGPARVAHVRNDAVWLSKEKA